MKYLAIDYGPRNVGLALSDDNGVIAGRIPAIIIKTNQDFVDGIKLIVENSNPDKILMGIPPYGFIKEKIRKLEQKLEDELGIEVELVDEDYTSQTAEVGTSRRFKKEKSHSEAARLMLQGYLDLVNSKSKDR